MKCERCGKELSGSVKYHVTMPNFDGETETYTWCRDCYISFKASLIDPTRTFTDVAPAEIDIEGIKEQAKNFKWEDK